MRIHKLYTCLFNLSKRGKAFESFLKEFVGPSELISVNLYFRYTVISVIIKQSDFSLEYSYI